MLRDTQGPVKATSLGETGLGLKQESQGKGAPRPPGDKPPTPRTCQASRQMNSGLGVLWMAMTHSPLLCDPLLQLGQEELPMETVDGRDVGENASGDFWRDPCFCQLGAENLSTEKPTVVTDWEPARHLPQEWALGFLLFIYFF